MVWTRAVFTFLFILPLLIIILFVFSFARKKRRGVYLRGDRTLSNIRKQIIMETVFILGYILLIFALMGPSWGIKNGKKGENKTIIFFLIDNSYSMIAEDIYPNRLEKAKSVIIRIIKKFDKKWDFALISFAGDSKILVPPTKDIESFSNYLMALNPDMNEVQGTSFNKIFNLLKQISKNKKYNPFFILLSDGENFDKGWEFFVKKIKQQGAVIFSIGIGTIEGAPIPERAKLGNIVNWKLDSKGETIITKLNTFSLLKISPPPDNYFITKNYSDEKRMMRKIKKSLDRYGKTRILIIKPDKSFVFMIFSIILFLIFGVFLYDKK
jgi:Ca-activated chloride channel family protein